MVSYLSGEAAMPTASIPHAGLAEARGPRPLERIFMRVDSGLDSLGQALSELESRIQPLLSQREDADSNSATPVPLRDETSTVSRQLHEYADRIESITAHVHYLARNVES